MTSSLAQLWHPSQAMRQRFPLVGLGLLVVAVLATSFAPEMFALLPSLEGDILDRLCPMSWEHPLGCDLHGVDVLAALVHGAQITFQIVFSVIAITATVGTLVGLLSGFLGGWIDLVLMRVVDIVLAFPGILLALAVTALIGPSVATLIFAMSISGWTSYARIVRSQVLSLKHREYVLASRSLGAGPMRLMFVHILPNTVSSILITATFSIASVIITEASLSFLGFGAAGKIPTWGELLHQGKSVLLESPHLAFFPGLLIALVVLSANFFGDWLKDRWMQH